MKISENENGIFIKNNGYHLILVSKALCVMPKANPLVFNTYLKDHDLSHAFLRDLYIRMLEPRLIEEKMLVLLRQGKISKWFSGIGQEAIAAGITAAIDKSEYILPMHRNLGVFTGRGIPLHRLFSQWQGGISGFTKGRDRSFHFGTQEYKIVGMISHLGPQLGVACGIALGDKLMENKKITAVFTGEGGTSEGDFHEALNVASVWDLPVLFCIENNGYGLSTPINEQYRCKHLVDRAQGYGMEGHRLDGNNILEVFTKIRQITESMRENPRPVLIEFDTFRMRGHEEASGTKYVPKETLDFWGERDPVLRYLDFLLDENILDTKQDQDLRKQLVAQIDRELNMAYSEDPLSFTQTAEINDVYAPHSQNPVKTDKTNREIRFVDAVSEGLSEGMQRFENTVLMGQDIAEYGGVFKVTEGFVEKFGKNRIRNTPICESAIIGAAMGLSINGFKAIVEMQFADFVSSGFNPIVNYLAKSHYRWGQPADVVIRMPCGGGVGAGPFHSQTNEAWFTHVPGLKVVYPAFPADGKGLLTASIEEPNPVLFFEHKALYRTVRGQVPKGYYNLPLGSAATVKKGSQLSIITYGAGVHWALAAAAELPEVSMEILDLRTLSPWDKKTVEATIKKTGKVLLLTEDNLTGNFMTDISAYIAENCFELLDAPIALVTSLDTPIPFAEVLESQYLPKDRLVPAILKMCRY